MKPMVERTELYKNMILNMMDTINAMNNNEQGKTFIDPICYKDEIWDMIANNVCLNKEEYIEYPVYSVFNRHIVSLAMMDKHSSDENAITIKFYTDMKYSSNPCKYNRISYGINVSIEECYINIEPYLDLVYMNIISRLPLSGFTMDPKFKCYPDGYTFYDIYGIMHKAIKESIFDENMQSRILYNTKDEEYSINIIEEMAILATLVYMKTVLYKDEYEKFVCLDKIEEKNTDEIDMAEFTKLLLNITTNLSTISKTTNKKNLFRILSKIESILDKEV